MGVTFQIPSSARWIPTLNIFEATFNNPVFGKYSFNIAANQNQRIIKLQKNVVYLIARVSIGGDISEENYLNSIDELSQITLKREITKQRIYQNSYNVVNFIDDQDVIAWVLSEKKDDYLTIDYSGILNQIIPLVGKTSIKMHVSYTIYAIDNTSFYSIFRDIDSPMAGRQVKGGL